MPAFNPSISQAPEFVPTYYLNNIDRDVVHRVLVCLLDSINPPPYKTREINCYGWA